MEFGNGNHTAVLVINVVKDRRSNAENQGRELDFIRTRAILRDYDITGIADMSRYDFIQDAMKYLPSKYYFCFKALEQAGYDCIPFIQKYVRANDNVIAHLIRICKDMEHEIRETDINHCKEMLDIELQMFISRNTSFRNLVSIINTFTDEYSKTRWVVNSKDMENIRFYFGS